MVSQKGRKTDQTKKGIKTMMTNHSVKTATKTEVKMYKKVENILDTNDIWEEFFDLICDEEIDDLLDNTIQGESLLAMMEEYGLTAKEVCAWYFIEVDADAEI
jgi:hypothetical protein